MASVVLILLNVENELSYDRFHDKGDQIYKVFLERIYPDHTSKYATIPHSFAEVMSSDFPEVETSVRLFNLNAEFLVQFIDESGNEKKFEEQGILLADSTFFDVFSVEFLKGDKSRALYGASDVIVTEETAIKYFGDSDPIGKMLTINFGGQPTDLTVAGVTQNVPENSHFEYNFLVSPKVLPFINNVNFLSFFAHTYLLLTPGTSPKDLEAKFPDIVEQYASPQIEQNLNLTYKEYVDQGNGYDYHLVNLQDIHLNPVKYQAQMKTGGSKTYVNTFILIASLILVIACINFMNLATARSSERAKEVGVRKTMGSARTQLIWQFLAESILISFVSLILAIILTLLALPYFNTLTQKTLTLSFSGWIPIGLLGFSIIVGLLAGSYPAFILSSFKPAEILKGDMKTKKENSLLRNGLVVFQFAVSIILIAGTLIVQNQMSYIFNKNLGFDKERVLVVENAGVLAEQFESFKNEIKNFEEIDAAGATSHIPGGGHFGIQFLPEGKNEVVTVNGTAIDDDYIETMGLEIISGRNFSRDFNDSAYVIINQQAANLFDVDDPVGLKISLSNLNGQNIDMTVAGVVKDFHYMSLHEEISPFVFMSQEPGLVNTLMTVKLKANQIQAGIDKIEAKWDGFVEERPFQFSFVDRDLEELYETDLRSSTILKVFSLLAILIACVGLFGLAAYTAGVRTKEIGVRKVLGASVGSVVYLLSKDFTKLIIIAFVLAVPVSWYFADRWLDSFAYQTKINPLIFLLAGFISLLIALLTVSYQSIKAAIVNPVNSLRSE